MDNIIRATYTHPDLASLGILEGHLKHDPWEGKTLFFPDEKHADALLSRGYEVEGGLFVEGATVNFT